MSKKKNENYLDYIPVIDPRNTWETGTNGRVTIHMVHRGFFAWIAQRFFHRPRVSHIDLDELGSFLFCQINGERTVGTLAELVREAFGSKAEPLYPRLVKYMQILRNNHFIYFAGRDRSTK
ncbi:MAG: PqqD family protein [Clostridium sp.]|nr:PqqD family protein [Clostridium sp.]